MPFSPSPVPAWLIAPSPPSPFGGEGWGEGGVFGSWRFRREQELSDIPSGCPSSFLLLVQEKGTKEKDPRVSRRHRYAAPVHCATRRLRAGANSAIHGLEQSRLSPEVDCVARRDNGHSARKHHACSPVWFRGWRVRKTSRIGRLPPQHPIAERRVCPTQRPPARSARMSCRVAQEAGGERRGCLSTGTCEFAPAAGFRATQGTAFAQRTTHDVRVPFLWATFLWASKERWLGQPEGMSESSLPIYRTQT